MERDLPTPVPHPPSLEWCPHTTRRTQGAKEVKVAIYHLGEKALFSGGCAVQCVGTIWGKEGGIQVLAGLAPSSQTIGSNKRVIHEQVKRSSWTTEVNNIITLAAKLGKGRRKLARGHLAAKLGEGRRHHVQHKLV